MNYIKGLFVILISLVLISSSAHSRDKFAKLTDKEIYDSLITKGYKNCWASYPIGSVVAMTALEFAGVEYKGGTLEGEGGEQLRINLRGVDCVTLAEYSLAIARNIHSCRMSFSEFLKEIETMRYRSGRMTDYISRLHYTTDWIRDNVEKGIVKDITRELNGVENEKKIFFMSKNADKYPSLRGNEFFIERIATVEKLLNAGTSYYIPKSEIKSIESKLQNGDIVAFTSSIDGLDYSHIGLIITNGADIKLLHASSTAGEVVVGELLHQYIVDKKNMTGISVLRPIEP